MPSDVVIFTDLDGTLLDLKSYSFEAALPAIRFIKSKSVPLVICTSKTRAEIELYRKMLGNREPFISENGGGIFIPSSYFSNDFNYHKEMNDYRVLELGMPHQALVEVLSYVRRSTGVNLKGLSEMTVGELMEVTGLNKEQAELAGEREYDEPFIIYGSQRDKERVKEEITKRGFNHTEGGIFHHIMGDSDKGKAVKILIKLFEEKFSKLKTIGIGDSPNDLPMLEAVDIPVLVRKPGGQYDPRIRLDNITLAEGIGPEGWNKAVLDLLERVGDY